VNGHAAEVADTVLMIGDTTDLQCEVRVIATRQGLYYLVSLVALRWPVWALRLPHAAWRSGAPGLAGARPRRATGAARRRHGVGAGREITPTRPQTQRGSFRDSYRYTAVKPARITSLTPRCHDASAHIPGK